MRVRFSKDIEYNYGGRSNDITFNTRVSKYPREKNLPKFRSIRDNVNGIFYTVHSKINPFPQIKRNTEEEEPGPDVTKMAFFNENNKDAEKLFVNIKKSIFKKVADKKKEEEQEAFGVQYKNHKSEIDAANKAQVIFKAAPKKPIQSIAKAKADLAQKTQINKRRFEINDYEVEKSRENAKMHEVNKNRKNIAKMVRAFNRMKTEQEEIKTSLIYLRNSLDDISQRLEFAEVPLDKPVSKKLSKKKLLKLSTVMTSGNQENP